MKTGIPLRWLLSFHLGLALVVQSAIVAALAWQVLLPQMRADTALSHQAVARAVAGEVAAHMLGGERQLVALADYVEQRTARRADNWDDLLDAQCGNGSIFEAIYIADGRNETITAIGLARAGRAKRIDLMGLDLSGRGFCDTAKALGKPFWSETFLSTASSRMAVAVTIPMSGEAIIGEITVDQLSSLIRRLPVKAELLTMILDRRGRIVADSRGLLSGQQFNLAQLPPIPDDRGGAAASADFDLDGVRMVGSVVAVDRLGWKVLVAQTYRTAHQSIRSTFSTILIGLAAAVLLALALAWFQANKLTGPFRALSEQAQAIAGGQYFLTQSAVRTREFAQFRDTLQKMAHTIRQREQQILDSENNLKITLDSLGDAVIATDVDGIITRMNPSAEKLTGWAFAAAGGKRLPEVFRIVDAHSRKTVDCPVEKVLAEGRVIGLANHAVLISRSGDEYQIAESGAPIRQADGRIAGVVIVFRDVTESHAQERLIRENEKRLQDITANVPGVVYRFKSTRDHVYSMTFISRGAADIFALKADPTNFLAQFRRRLLREELGPFDSSIRHAVDQAAPWQYEGRFKKPGGETIWFSGNAVPHREGDAIVYYGVLMDITERKQLEESLRRTQFCFDKASIGIYWLGERGQILNANEHACLSLGYSYAELCNLSIFDIDPNFSTDIWPDHIENLRRLRTQTIETHHRHKNGAVFPVKILINLMNFEDQEFHVAFVEDISDRRRAEQEKRQLESALLHAQKMEAIGTLAGGIAHDFNNILAAVVGYSELSLKKVDKASALHRNLSQILGAAMRAKDLVQQILTFSRQQEHEHHPLQIAPLIKETLKLLRASLPTTIEIHQQIDSGLDSVLAEPSQINRIIMNLCTNAAHAMEENGGKLTVTLSQVALGRQDMRLYPGLRPGKYLKLSVQDTGTGIPAGIGEKIFDPYFTTKPKGKGTGLGLSVVHGIIHNYGGAVYASSEPGPGTTFKAFIPAIEQCPTAGTSSEPQLPTGNERILFVDDEPALVEIGQTLLEMLGYTVTACESSIEALDVFQKAPGKIDLVISDVTMPEMTGDKLAIELLKTRRDLPIILCTGFSDRISRETIGELGVKALAMKPLSKKDLAALVRKVLDEARQGVFS